MMARLDLDARTIDSSTASLLLPVVRLIKAYVSRSLFLRYILQFVGHHDSTHFVYVARHLVDTSSFLYFVGLSCIIPGVRQVYIHWTILLFKYCTLVE